MKKQINKEQAENRRVKKIILSGYDCVIHFHDNTYYYLCSDQEIGTQPYDVLCDYELVELGIITKEEADKREEERKLTFDDAMKIKKEKEYQEYLRLKEKYESE